MILRSLATWDTVRDNAGTPKIMGPPSIQVAASYLRGQIGELKTWLRGDVQYKLKTAIGCCLNNIIFRLYCIKPLSCFTKVDIGTRSSKVTV
jgi:hypothetical protein